MPSGSTHGPALPAYRPDIDGLRALAVLPVIAFHMGVQAVGGGFIGVDVFFVISGYLIGSRILADVEAGRFSLTDFYARRVRRIVPALAVMLAVTTAAALVVEYPGNLVTFGESLIATSLSFSNLYFWWTADYFGQSAETMALLHTWSLSVEEQFYLVFPPLILLLWKWRGRLDAVLWALFAATLVASTVVAVTDPLNAFYLPHYRIWEFLIGILLVRRRHAALDRPRVREGVAWLGVGLIIGSIFVLDTRVPFPGATALPAALGAALVIAAGHHGGTVLGRLLGSAPVRGIGLISYSLYLWHWPVIVHYKLLKPTQFLTFTDKVLLSAVILVLAVASWRFVEQPLRRSRRPMRVVFGAAGATAAAMVVAGAALLVGNGFPARFTPKELELLADLSDHAPARDEACFGGSREGFDDFDLERCLARDPTQPNVLLLGDSHASHLWYGLARHSGANVMQLTSNGCIPTLSRRNGGDPLCAAMLDYAFRTIPGLGPDLVLLSARWGRGDLAGLDETIDWLRSRGQRVMVSGPIIEYDAELPKLLALAERRDDPDLWKDHIVRRRLDVDRALADLARRKDVPYLSPTAALCPDPSDCRVTTPAGTSMQFDYGHLTTDGSDYLAKAMLGGRSIMDAARAVN